MKPCPKCNGLGYYPEHAPASQHGADGECIYCPIKCPCEVCQTTGEVEEEYQQAMDRKVLDKNDLPF